MNDVEITPLEQWCMRHWQPYREDRSLNGLLATLLLAQAFINGHDGEAKGNSDVMNRLMREKAPICCWAGEEKLALIMEQATSFKGAA